MYFGQNSKKIYGMNKIMGSPTGDFPLRGIYMDKNRNNFNITKAFVKIQSSFNRKNYLIIFMAGKYSKHTIFARNFIL